MPAATAFSATYLDAPAGTLYPNTQRYRVAGAVEDLTLMLQRGESAASAQAEVGRKRRHMQGLWRAAAILNAPTIVTDFQAITTP